MSTSLVLLRPAVPIALVLLLAGATAANCTGSLETTIRARGFTEIQPASNLLQPGTIVHVLSKEPLEVAIVCDRQRSLGPHFTPLTSVTASAELTELTSRSFDLAGHAREAITADARFSAIRNVTLQLSNATVSSVSDALVFDNLGRRDPSCTRALKERARAGLSLTMITSAISADVVYKVELHDDSGLAVEAQAALLKDLALTLQLDVAHASTDSVEGRDLIWGVTDDPFLAGLEEYPEPEAPSRTARPSLLGAQTSPARLVPPNPGP